MQSDELVKENARLQAEVERLKQVAIDRKNELTKLCTERNELQAEVERLRADFQTYWDTDGTAYADLQSELTKARELLSKAVEDAGGYLPGISEFLSGGH